MQKHYPVLLAILTLWLASLACEPVIAIGWPELITLFIIFAILMGPLMFRFYRFLDKVQRAMKDEEKKNK